MFDLDDLRAQIRQRLRAPWPRQHAAHVEHSQSRQRTHVAILSRPSVGSMPAVYRGSASDRASCCKGYSAPTGSRCPSNAVAAIASAPSAVTRTTARTCGAPRPWHRSPQNGEQHDRHHWHDHDGQVARCQRGDHYRQDRARGKGGGGENRGLHGARSAVVGKAQFVTAMRAQRVMRHHLFGDRLCQRGRDAAADVDGGEFPCFGLGIAVQLGSLARQVGMFGIGLRADRDIFARRHRQRAADQRRRAGEQDGRCAGARRGGDADDQARYRDDAVIGTQHRRAQPAGAVDQVMFAGACGKSVIGQAPALNDDGYTDRSVAASSQSVETSANSRGGGAQI